MHEIPHGAFFLPARGPGYPGAPRAMNGLPQGPRGGPGAQEGLNRLTGFVEPSLGQNVGLDHTKVHAKNQKFRLFVWNASVSGRKRLLFLDFLAFFWIPRRVCMFFCVFAVRNHINIAQT